MSPSLSLAVDNNHVNDGYQNGETTLGLRESSMPVEAV
jgi:hypothetical protein